MWYSSLKTGITTIDLDHANIDFLLGKIADHGLAETHLESLISALITHFRHEEKIILELKKTFPDEHKKEHERLANYLEDRKKRWLSGELEAAPLAQQLKEMLLLHVSEFDMKLPDI